MKKKFFILIFSAIVLMPLATSAATPLLYFGGNPPLVSCTGINCNTCDLFETAQRIIYFGMTLVLFVFGPIMITIGGIMMLISGGSEERFTSGRKMATGAVIGILIALGAFLIVNTLLVTIAQRINGFDGSGFTISCSARSPFVPAQNNGSQNQHTECSPDGTCGLVPNSYSSSTPASGSNDTNRGDNGDQP